MKRCPSCNRVETDDTLAFCRADGIALVSDSLSATESNPGSGSADPSSEIETSILPHSIDAGSSRAAGATTVFEAQPELGRTRRLVSVKRRRVIVLAIAGLVVVTLALLVYIYRTRSSNTTAIDSIAVIAFVNASGDPNNEYLSDGITESIINSLSQLPNLGVIARNSAFHYKGKDADATTVGRELNVRSILTGRVLQRGDNLSISVELVDTANNHQLWGQQYNRKINDVFAVQEEIAKEISEKLRVKLSGTAAKRPTENLKAFQYYMQGRSYTQRRTRKDLLKAIEYDKKALQEDPNYALAYAGLADAYANLGFRGYIAPIEGRRQAEEAARKALELDENLAESHVALGALKGSIFAPYDFSLAERELRRAIELSPSLPLAHMYLGFSLIRQGRLDESLSEIVKARELDPLSPIIARLEVLFYYLKPDYVRAMQLQRQANELSPAFNSQFEIGVYIQNRLFDEALTELEKAKVERRNDPLLIYDTGMVYAAQGKHEEALQIIKKLEEMSGSNLDQAHWIAKVYASLNEKELSFSWLQRGLTALAIGSFDKADPVWDPIRSDQRFADLTRRMGIP